MNKGLCYLTTDPADDIVGAGEGKPPETVCCDFGERLGRRPGLCRVEEEGGLGDGKPAVPPPLKANTHEVSGRALEREASGKMRSGSALC